VTREIIAALSSGDSRRFAHLLIFYSVRDAVSAVSHVIKFKKEAR